MQSLIPKWRHLPFFPAIATVPFFIILGNPQHAPHYLVSASGTMHSTVHSAGKLFIFQRMSKADKKLLLSRIEHVYVLLLFC